MSDGERWLEPDAPGGRQTVRLFRRSWAPAAPPRGTVLLVHGLGEHSGRYEHVARRLTERGFSVHAVDHEGHGRSDGRRGHIDRFARYLDGVEALLEAVRNEEGDCPRFLLGHSMGGLVSALFLLRHPSEFEGCVLSGPLVTSDAEPPALVMLLNRLLSVLAPRLGILKLDATAVSRDPDVVAAYIADPLVHDGKVTTRLVNELFVAAAALLDNANRIELPLLLLHGEADRLTSPEGSKRLHALAGSDDKTIRLYPGLYHEIFNEPEKDAVLDDVLDWLERHLPPARAID